MSYEREKKLLAKKILALGQKVGLNSMSAIVRESKLAWKQIGNLDKGIGNPTFETFCKLAENLKFDINDLIQIDKKKSKS